VTLDSRREASPSGRIEGTLIAVDAMGGDDAPGPEVAGCVRAFRDHGVRSILVGDEPRLRAELARLGASSLDIPIRHTSEVITMHDHPGQAARGKRDSSMRVAFDLVKKGEAGAVVSCGNSGALLACGLFVLGRLPGVERPGIVLTFPTLSSAGHVGQVALLDMGANVECKASTLAQFAVLGATFARLRDPSIGRPLVGLLSNGEEDSKGTELLREAHALLRGPAERDFDYVGFVEGRDIFQFNRGPERDGRCLDVVVTDGFTGNVVLKTAEGAARLLGDLFRLKLKGTLLGQLGALLMMPTLRQMKHVIDVERRGGALLIGVSGVVIICHGRSSERAIAAALVLARDQVESGVAPAVTAAIERHRPLWAGAAGSAAS
jgi:phosphate acyltransferase